MSTYATKPTLVSANTVFDATDYGDIIFQPATTITGTVTFSLDAVNYQTWRSYDTVTDAAAATLTAGSIYSTDGGGFLKFPVAVTVRGSQ